MYKFKMVSQFISDKISLNEPLKYIIEKKNTCKLVLISVGSFSFIFITK